MGLFPAKQRARSALDCTRTAFGFGPEECGALAVRVRRPGRTAAPLARHRLGPRSGGGARNERRVGERVAR